MLESSKDLLYIVIAFSVLWFTIFVCWLIYYAAMVARQINLLIKNFRGKLNKIEETLAAIREKLEHSASYLGLLVEGVRQMADYLTERREKREKRKKK